METKVPPRTYWQPEIHSGASQGVGRYYGLPPTDIQQPLIKTIHQALQEQCMIPVRHYLLCAVLEDGTIRSFSGPERVLDEVVHQTIDIKPWVYWLENRTMPGFRRREMALDSTTRASIANGGQDPTVILEDPDHSDVSRRLTPGPGRGGHLIAGCRREGACADGTDEEGACEPRKRRRTNLPPGRGPAVVLKIGDDEAVKRFYKQGFEHMQQIACRSIAKAWIKLVEPKKKTMHPYSGERERAPDWWPKPWGTTKEERVRHKEPDHLYKRERIHLLIHILRMVVQSGELQYADMRQRGLDVAKLEEAAFDALSGFFRGENNRERKSYLEEIFNVAKHEEALKSGRIDGATEISINTEDRLPEGSHSDDEESTTSTDDDDCSPAATSSGVPSTRITQDEEDALRGIDRSPVSGDESGLASSYESLTGHSPVRAHPCHGYVPARPLELGVKRASVAQYSSPPDRCTVGHIQGQPSSSAAWPVEHTGPATAAGMHPLMWHQRQKHASAPAPCGGAAVDPFSPHQQQAVAAAAAAAWERGAGAAPAPFLDAASLGHRRPR